MNPQESDRDVWEKRWASMPIHQLQAPPKIEVGVEGFGELTEVLISEVPPEYRNKLTMSTELCPVCGEATTETTRLPGSLYPKFLNGFT